MMPQGNVEHVGNRGRRHLIGHRRIDSASKQWSIGDQLIIDQPVDTCPQALNQAESRKHPEIARVDATDQHDVDRSPIGRFGQQFDRLFSKGCTQLVEPHRGGPKVRFEKERDRHVVDWSSSLDSTRKNTSGSCAPGTANSPLKTNVGTAETPISWASASSASSCSIPTSDAR